MSLSAVTAEAQVSKLRAGDIAVFSPDSTGHYLLQTTSSSVSPDSLFTYTAYPLRALDGDTIEAVVDLGFGLTTQQVLRLRGIDAPELITHDGMEAKVALEKMLARSSRVLIRIVKSDKYDRYLIDLYTVDSQGRTAYINNLLLAGEYAVKVYE